MAENFPRLMEHTKPQIHKAQITPSKINTSKIDTLIYLKFRKLTIKRQSWNKLGRGGTLTIEELHVRITSDISSENICRSYGFSQKQN
jgi:hypothetical protein